MAVEKLKVAVAAPLRQQVVEMLRGEIVAGAMAPGQRLVERELCEQTQVSRTSIREALRQLESEGFVESRPNKGIFVASLSTKDAREIYQVRAVLEGLAAQLFCDNATDLQRRKLSKAFDEIEAATSAGSAPKVLASKSRYYDVILEGAHNDMLRQTLGNLNARVMMLRTLTLGQAGRLNQSFVEMKAIHKALETGNGAAAFEACAAHVRSAAVVLMKALQE